MQHAKMPDFDVARLAGVAGAPAFAKGFQYAQQRAVMHVEWDSSESALRGLVRGSGGNFYATAVYFSALRPGLPPDVEVAECTCPVEFNCKHAVALVLTAVMAIGPAEPFAEEPASSQAVGWQQSLDSLLLTSSPGISAERPVATPLAIELTLANPPNDLGQLREAGRRTVSAPLRLLGRLVRPGKNGGWVNGGLSWSKLDSLNYAGDYQDDHVRLLRELYALYRSRGSRGPYLGYTYGDDKTIDITAFESSRLWPLLDEAQSAGLRLMYPKKLGHVVSIGSAEMCLDVTRDGHSGALSIVPVIRMEQVPDGAQPVAFIGNNAHGLVCVDSANAGRGGGDPAGWRFRLTRLGKPVPPQLQRMAFAGQRLEIPASEESRFLEGYYARLRRAASVISSDESFTPPTITGPDLVLRACYGADHDLEVTWEWSYRVGDSSLRASLDPAEDHDGYRDPAAEQAVLASVEMHRARFGLVGARRGTPGGAQLVLTPRMRLSGLDTMRFTTELLPLLSDQPGVIIEITGQPADYREAGDSLRIAISTDEVAGSTDWFDLGVTLSAEGREVPFIDVFLALSRGEQHMLLPDGAYFSLQKPELQALARLIEEARALQDLPPGELRISRYQAGLWDELAGLGVVGHQAVAWQEQVRGLLAPDDAGRTAPPAALQARLRPYQQDGFGWLAFLWKHRLGGILADDMGLGKTLQALALIGHARHADPKMPPFLVVAPTSVVGNWAAEAARFASHLKVVPISETVARSGQDLSDLTMCADAVVTSYTLLRIDFEAYAALDWAGVLLDEAQNAKNHQSKIYQCARRLAAPVKIAITGTPLENNLMELWSLLSITAPGLFPNPDRFRDFYARPIEKQGDAELLAQLQRRIKPLVKRRTKEQVAADLPAKQEQVLEVELHPQHRKVYQTHLQRERQKVLGLIEDIDAHRFTIFRSLTLLRQLSLHAGLVDDAHRDLPSSKIDALLEQLLAVAAGGHRALVFSQFTGFLGIVRERLDAEGLSYCYLDGRTRNRPAVIERFKSGAAPVFLISLKAGGFGLNLTEADYCFLLDPWWNPATEAQAVDRAHRIGQTRNVIVYRLVARDTIEEKVMALKAKKARLFSSVLDQGNVFSTALSAEDIRGLLA
ncbi:MAG: DEAD/DEAH box helicase [Streptosporangiaceae bacterium]